MKFHLAIPCRDITEAILYYSNLKCSIGRVYETHATMDFFGNQLVVHKNEDWPKERPSMYPRHFGVNFDDYDDWKKLLNHCRNLKLEFFAEPFSRGEGLPEEHISFFLIDPSNNLLEFKHYKDERMSL